MEAGSAERRDAGMASAAGSSERGGGLASARVRSAEVKPRWEVASAALERRCEGRV